jgi:coenzyme F420-0:L-glutamate ligase/coenzyme F420-1:gamma-L-glutamate ligase
MSPMVGSLSITPVHGLPEIKPGDDLAGLIVDAARTAGVAVRDGDVVAVAQKIVSKAEGRIVRLADVQPGPRALAMAAESGKDPRQLEVVLQESVKVVRWAHGVLISETRHGFVCANAGVDRSNAGAPDTVILLPLDPDASAARLRDAIKARAGATVAIELRVTEIAVADEVAAAAELVMGKLDRCPVAVVRGLVVRDPSETAREYVRPAEKDLFR